MVDTDRARVPEPADGDERDILLGWLDFHRDALRAKCAGLTEEQLTDRSAGPSTLSLLGLVRHLAEMEHAYGSWPAGSSRQFTWIWGDYAEDRDDDIECRPQDVPVSMSRWEQECARTDEALAARGDMADRDTMNERSVRWNVAKLVGEYARHNGHADIIRERIDGQTGE
jgi:hypothetical protein